MAKYLTRQIIVNLLRKPQSHLQLSKVSRTHIWNKYGSFVQFVLQSRSLCNNFNSSDHTCTILNYDDYYFNHKPILYNIIETLKEILDITNAEVDKILTDYPQLKKKSRANILDNYHNLLEADIEKSVIMKNIWLLAHDNNKLKEKLNCISKLKMNNNQLIPWLRLTLEELKKYIFYMESDMESYTYNKIEHLAYRLECSIEELCKLTVQYNFLIKIPISYIDKKLNILYEYNVNNKQILKDLWVFRYTESNIRQRCELYKDTKNIEVKTWAVRCPLRVISRAIQKSYAKYNILQHYKNINEYLIDKLKIDENTFNHFITKSPNVLRINLVKLNVLIELMQQNGITGKELLQHQRIFYFSTTTVQNRINILNKMGVRVKLPLLVSSEKVFEQYVNNYRLKQDILQNQSIKCYLINKLNIDEATLENALKKGPNILRINVIKLDEFINILQENGIKSNDILYYKRIFYFKIQTICKRIDALKQVGLPLKMSILINSQKMFDNYIKLCKLNKIDRK